MSHHPYALGIVGTGHIAAVIVGRLIESGYLAADRIIVSPSKKLAAHPLGTAVAQDNTQVVREAGMVMLSVTPQRFAEAAESIRGVASTDHLFISLMAGVPTQRVAQSLGGSMRVIRAMPNLPFGLGRGVTGLFRGEHADLEDLEEVKHLFNAGGVSVEVEREVLMDAVTAVAGSGPAYFYYFVEMMMAGGIAAGLKREDAQILAAHACVGAGAMLLEKGASPAELREAVTSPGGTTQAAMNKLRECQVSEHVTEAVLAAFRRSQELGRIAAGET
ncbi:MAG TPA: pyrroline-5-carboxylate reductase [Phycisphaerae bacterium]|nr:pyrroline-5-carboxylate reductase [Phycisphaerae bacterium]